ncbi:YeiH family protein [Persicobacter sp. CCB-QB2]|uniref:YeiH family protein n=1 Tax=Persicobacter sp. CCB-QB2 TaxID=1561025 RepID=UPI0006A9EFAE|nr:putative sulfate exporter family transporter [Persicobacter sp. CCB-QB2]
MQGIAIPQQPDFKKMIWWGAGIFCLMPFCSPFIALIIGVILSNFLFTDYQQQAHKWTKILLNFAIVGMGFGMSFQEAWAVGSEGFGITALTIAVVLGLGALLTKWLKIDKETGLLISFGTAICGGSAIAAAGATLNAKEENMSVALGTVFLFNALALVVFPFIGHLLQMPSEAFGWWAAMAIHDTSSVVGAAGTYGGKALEIATTVKLARALWIVPLCAALGWWKKSGQKLPIPTFLIAFIAVILIHPYLPGVEQWGIHLTSISKRMMTLALFWVGTGLHFSTLKKVGLRAFAMGLILWVVVGSLALYLL